MRATLDPMPGFTFPQPPPIRHPVGGLLGDQGGIHIHEQSTHRGRTCWADATSELVHHRHPTSTQIVSSDEFYPDPQNERQREVEARLLAWRIDFGCKLGLTVAGFFQTAAGMAASFVAMNEVYGPPASR